MNEHIEMNLKKYIELENPEYAIMLGGRWGSGKTYFIDKFIEDNKTDSVKFIKISLFGIKQLNEINQKILFKVFIKKESNLIDSLMTIGMKVTDSISKKINLSINDIPIEQIIQKLDKKFIFIFDDFERIDIKISELLGYINYLIEEANCKVIILANEDEIIDKTRYSDFKEKVIGKTFEIQQSFEAIFGNFLNLTKHSKNILEQNNSIIKEIYFKSKYNNLRHIRQAMIDFDYLYELFEDKYKSNNNFINNFIYIFFSLFIELRKGYLKEDELRNSNYGSLTLFTNNTETREKTSYERILDKYKLINYDMKMFSNETWVDILFKNNINKNSINNIISKTIYFEEYESWYKLYYFWSTEDEDFSKSFKDVWYKFINNQYIEHGKLLIVISILLYLSKNEISKISIVDIIVQAKKNINDNCKTDFWKIKKYEKGFSHRNSFEYKGISYSYYDEIDEFKDIQNYLENKSLEAFESGLKINSNILLSNLLNNNLRDFDKELNENFQKIPIFNHIDIERLIDVIQKILHSNLHLFGSILEERYEDWKLERNTPDLIKELETWKYIHDNLLTNINDGTSPLKYFLLKEFKGKYLKKIIRNIENAKNNLNKNET